MKAKQGEATFSHLCFAQDGQLIYPLQYLLLQEDHFAQLPNFGFGIRNPNVLNIWFFFNG